MKHIGLSLYMLVAATFAACTGDGAGDICSPMQTPLQIELAEVMVTRNAITGTTLPDGSQYGIFVCQGESRYTINDGDNVRVEYANGKSTPANTILLPDNDCNVYAYYPYNTEATLGNLLLDMTTQTDYLLGTSIDSDDVPIFVSSSQPKARIRFSHIMALLTLNISQGGELPEKPNVLTSICLNNIAVRSSLNVMTGGPGTYYYVYENYRHDCNITATDIPQTANIILTPMTKANGLTAILTINGKDYSITLPLQEWKAGMHYTYNVKIHTTETSEAALEITEAVITPRDNTNMSELTVNVNTNTPAVGGTIGTAVDLGLSVKWADHNVGASAETQVGGRYMWGDPTGTATSATYSMPSLTNISGTQYDIATTQWGSSWRLPTYDEIKELVDNTTYKWTTRNGVEGGLFTSKKAGYTNKSIFFPHYGSVWTDSGLKTGSVWTGTKSSNSSNASYAWILDYSENAANTKYSTQGKNSNPVRPVCK